MCLQKPGNILLGGDMKPKVTDFGASRNVHRDFSSGVDQAMTANIGYIHYALIAQTAPYPHITKIERGVRGQTDI